MWFPEFRGGGVSRGFLTLRLLLAGQNRAAPLGNGNAKLGQMPGRLRPLSELY